MAELWVHADPKVYISQDAAVVPVVYVQLAVTAGYRVADMAVSRFK